MYCRCLALPTGVARNKTGSLAAYGCVNGDRRTNEHRQPYGLKTCPHAFN